MTWTVQGDSLHEASNLENVLFSSGSGCFRWRIILKYWNASESFMIPTLWNANHKTVGTSWNRPKSSAQPWGQLHTRTGGRGWSIFYSQKVIEISHKTWFVHSVSKAVCFVLFCLGLVCFVFDDLSPTRPCFFHKGTPPGPQFAMFVEMQWNAMNYHDLWKENCLK